MSKEQENKAITVRWLEGFWGRSWTPEIVDDLAADDILIQFSLQTPCRGVGVRQRTSCSASAKYSKTSNFAARPIS